MRRETQNVLLVLLGGALLKISFTGTYLRYVKPGHQWLLVTGGVVMLALAAVSIVRDITGRHDGQPGGGEGDHDHHHHSSRSAWLLVLPVLTVFLVGPPALGADSVERSAKPAPVSDGKEAYPPLPAGGVLPMQVTDFVMRAAWDSTDSLHGRTVRLTGFVVREGDVTYLARFSISCCAADAFPRRIRLSGADLSAHPDDAWVEAVGELVPGSATKANGYIPFLTVAGVRAVAEPEDPYEHPTI